MTTERVLVNVADWDGPADLPAGWLIANAPRPLNGERTWQGAFRHGVLYAAMPAQPEGDQWDRDRHTAILRSWASLDGWLIEFITNAEIERRVLAKFAEYGYASEDEAGVTIAEQAACMRLPWHEEG